MSERTKGEGVVALGVFICELRDSYTLRDCRVLPDRVPLTRQPSLLLKSLLKQLALMWRLCHRKGESGYNQKPKNTGNLK